MADSNIAWLTLRIVVGVQFIAAGAFSALKWTSTVDFNSTLTGATLAPAATAVAVGLLLVGGASLAFKVRVRAGGVLLLLFLIPASVRHLLVAHDIALHEQAATELAGLARRGQLASFAKNIGLVAVVLFLIATRGGPGRRSEPRGQDTSTRSA